MENNKKNQDITQESKQNLLHKFKKTCLLYKNNQVKKIC